MSPSFDPVFDMLTINHIISDNAYIASILSWLYLLISSLKPMFSPITTPENKIPKRTIMNNKF